MHTESFDGRDGYSWFHTQPHSEDCHCDEQDPETSQAAMLINSLDMTQHKKLEIELEQAKRELLR